MLKMTNWTANVILSSHSISMNYVIVVASIYDIIYIATSFSLRYVCGASVGSPAA